MDTSSFIVKRENLRAHMEAERVQVTVASEAKPPLLGILFSLGMKWGLLPMAQEWALASVGRWVYDKVRGSKSRN